MDSTIELIHLEQDNEIICRFSLSHMEICNEKKFDFKVKDREINLDNSSLTNNKLDQLKQVIGDSRFQQILNEGNYTDNLPKYMLSHLSLEQQQTIKFPYYKTNPSLPLYYQLKDYLIVYGYGELNPGNEIIEVYGVWIVGQTTQ